MIKIAELKPSCDPKYVLQNLNSLKKEATKLDYLTDTLERCAIQKAPTTKKKRAMSGYNCFIRVAVKKGQKFKDVVKSKAWRTLSDQIKASWSNLAKEGCPQRLWEGD